MLTFMVIFSMWSSSATAIVNEQYFHALAGYKLQGGTVLETISVNGMSKVLCASHCATSCHVAMFSVIYNMCVTLEEKAYDMDLSWVEDDHWSVLYKRFGRAEIRHSNWTMVFRAQSEINSRLYDMWDSIGVHHDNSNSGLAIPVGCLRLDTTLPCTTHFRSHILDNWINISEVRFSLYTNGAVVKEITFNGTGSTVTSWFDQSRILFSSWSGLSTDITLGYFSIIGLFSGGDTGNICKDNTMKPLRICAFTIITSYHQKNYTISAC